MAFDLSTAQPDATGGGVFDLATATPVEQPKQETTAIDRLKQKYAERTARVEQSREKRSGGTMLGRAIETPQTLFEGVGQAAGFAGDVAGEVIGAGASGLYNAIAPDYAKEGFSNALNYAAGTKTAQNIGRGAKWVGEQYNKIPEDVRLPVESAGNIVMVAPVVAPLKKIVGAAVDVAGKAIPKAVPEKMYASALKLPTTMSPAERASAISTGLSERAVPKADVGIVDKWLGMKGHSDIMNKIDSLNSEISDIIQTSAKQGGTISAPDVATRLDALISKGDEIKRVDPAFGEAVKRVKDEFMAGGGDIPTDSAQKMKQHIYKVYQDYYGMPDAVGAYIQGKKAVASGLKQELETLYPEIKGLNMEEGRLLSFLDPYNRAIGRIQNRDIVGLGMQTAPVAGKALSGNAIGAAATTAAKLIDTPAIKARLAILLNAARGKELGAGSLYLGGNALRNVSPFAASASVNALNTGE